MCSQHHQDKKKNGNCRQDNIEPDVPRPNRGLVIQVARPSGPFDLHILEVREVVGKVVGIGVAMGSHRFQSKVDYLLHPESLTTQRHRSQALHFARV